MKQAIHLLDPVKNTDPGDLYETMRCGLTRYVLKDTYKTTTNPAEVTCIKCRSYINNPWRVLRKYGKVKVVDSFFALLWADYGYKLDVVATIFQPGDWMVSIAYGKRLYSTRIVTATNMADLGFQLVKIVEKEIIEIRKSN